MNRNFKKFVWKNQLISNTLVNCVDVKIYEISNKNPFSLYSKTIISTDGKRLGRTQKTCSNFSYILTSTGITDPHNSKYNRQRLHINIYIAGGFDIKKIEQLEFCGKEYVILALQSQKISKTEPTDTALIPKFPIKFCKTFGNNSICIYNELTQLAQKKDIEGIEKIFENYPLTYNYQAKFWKQLFEVEIANNQK